ncbi:tetraacyldisaccharide 4'-kinase [Candidatus Blochmanniella vafra str. BVAF]|uniref:Tetraacyldisaccharide 4'-kinase n=1 Tax=Blochmanniella vafra (strain BVAF) TaxID=859654 RepID=E8Q680_BLOVB|nr:tetraacyldisaccharide 4'-kinase [Candidatus Blochmannia vafer]ADV33774.1 tetraacyldisaccharide 4'-kinase [Candidatus Blochmannia vafer str. BVAF]
MFFRIWFNSSLCCLFLLPLSWIYGLLSILNRVSYQYGWRKIYKFSVPVIVIGNLTAGGNGKTPMVLWLIKQLTIRGWKVGVVSRGYGGKSNEYPIIVNELTSSNECGDEPMLIWKRTGVLVAVSPKRVDAVLALLQVQSGLDIIISDDGLQHYALFRDIEWVIINNSFRFGNGYWLPAGPMRERITRLNTVQAIIVNKADSNGSIKSGEILMQLYPSAVINIVTGEKKTIRAFKNVVAIAGIGYPNQFFNTLKKNGIIPIKTVAFSDHHVYSEQMLTALVSHNEVLFMTEKDAVKCLNFAHKNWWYVYIDVEIHPSDTEKLLYSVEGTIKQFNNK